MTKATIGDVTERLQTHARGTENADNPENLADYVWLLKHQRAASNTDEIWAALRKDFEHLNKLLNENSDFRLGREVAYAINGLLTVCLNYVTCENGDEIARNQILQIAWRIATAWDAVLAGDIEDISGHVDHEKTARGI
jgi:hypothetical protein